MKKNILFTLALLLAINTAFASVVIVNGLTHVYTGSMGQTIQGEIVLVNSSNEEQRVTFSLSEAIYSCTTNRVFTNEVSHSRSSISWFDGSLMDRVLASKEEYVYRFSIKIPKDESLKGSFWSNLMIGIEKPIREEKLNQHLGLSTKIRYAVGLLTHVKRFEEVQLDFKDLQVNELTEEHKELHVQIGNETLFVEGVKLSLEVYNTAGEKILVTTTDRNMVFPGYCRAFKMNISELPKGAYECILIAEAREKFIGTNVSLTIE